MKNYFRLKENLTPPQLSNFVSTAVSIARNKGITLKFISYLYENDNGVWFVGFQVSPNKLIHSFIQRDCVLSDSHSLIIDMTHGRNTVVFDNVLNIVQNPQKWILTNNYLRTITAE